MRHRKATIARFAHEISEKLKRRHFDEQFIEDLDQLERYGCKTGDTLDAFLRTAMFLHISSEGSGATRSMIDAYFSEYHESP